TLGVAPALGRGFLEGESEPGKDRVVVLGHALWQSRWGGRDDVLGESLMLDGEFYEIVGVMGKGHRPLDREWQLWAPLPIDLTDADGLDSSFYLQMVARLRDGISLEQADGELQRLAEGLLAKNPRRFTRDRVEAAEAVPLHEHVVGDSRSTLVLLLAAVGTILLVACANLANLLLARSEGRRREMAVRVALGAGWRRLFGQMMVESLVLAALGGAAGLLLSMWAFDSLRAQLPADMPRVSEVAIDGPVLAFAAGLALLAALFFGLAPAVRAARGNLASEMASGGRLAARRSWLASALVVGQVAASLALLVVATLLTRSLIELQRVNPGFRVEQTVAFRPVPSQERYGSHASVMRFYEELAGRLGDLPAVKRVGAIQLLPLSQGNWSFPYSYAGLDLPTDGEAGTPLPMANFRVVTPDYFRALDIPVVAGRPFTAFDGRASEPAGAGAGRTDLGAPGSEPPETGDAGPLRVGLINRALSDALWPGENPVGREIQLFGNLGFEIVGVVGNVHQHALADTSLPEIYWPLAQAESFGIRSLMVMVRAEGSVRQLGNSLRQAVWSVDPNVAVAEMHVLSDVVDSSVAGPRLRAWLLSSFALLALVLGVVGVYGLISCQVSERTREIGIRMALGARDRAILRQVLGSGLRLTALGLILGLTVAAAVGGWVQEHLFTVSARDLSIHAGASLLLLAAALAACWWPARRASRVDPAITLRHE
ncbi:MAG: ADOP family duplicated permease, partial [Holophagales bacterium]|nr:ADOP family duplicated permease [Holophagales bacterium]